MIVLDASVLIATFEATHPFHDRAAEILNGSAGEPMQISAVTAAEAMVHQVRAGVVSDPIGDLEITVSDVAADSYLRLAHLRAVSGLKMPDAIVLDLAVQSHAAIATFDVALAKAAQARGLDVLGANN